MPPRGVILEEDFYQILRDMARWWKRNPQTPKPDFRKRWPVLGGGGGACECPRNWYQLFFAAPATGGSFVLRVTVGASSYDATITIPATRATIGAELVALGPFASDASNYKIYMNGGLNGNNAIGILFEVPSGVAVSLSIFSQSLTPTGAGGAWLILRPMFEPSVPDDLVTP